MPFPDFPILGLRAGLHPIYYHTNKLQLNDCLIYIEYYWNVLFSVIVVYEALKCAKKC